MSVWVGETHLSIICARMTRWQHKPDSIEEHNRMPQSCNMTSTQLHSCCYCHYSPATWQAHSYTLVVTIITVLQHDKHTATLLLLLSLQSCNMTSTQLHSCCYCHYSPATWQAHSYTLVVTIITVLQHDQHTATLLLLLSLQSCNMTSTQLHSCCYYHYSPATWQAHSYTLVVTIIIVLQHDKHTATLLLLLSLQSCNMTSTQLHSCCYYHYSPATWQAHSYTLAVTIITVLQHDKHTATLLLLLLL